MSESDASLQHDSITAPVQPVSSDAAEWAIGVHRGSSAGVPRSGILRLQSRGEVVRHAHEPSHAFARCPDTDAATRDRPDDPDLGSGSVASLYEQQDRGSARPMPRWSTCPQSVVNEAGLPGHSVRRPSPLLQASPNTFVDL